MVTAFAIDIIANELTAIAANAVFNFMSHLPFLFFDVALLKRTCWMSPLVALKFYKFSITSCRSS
jgi:hypothetical protein